MTPRAGRNASLASPRTLSSPMQRRRQHTCDPANPHFKELGNWVPLLSYFGYPQQAMPPQLQLPTAQMTCLRILGTELSQDDYGYRYLQFNELEMYGQHRDGQPPAQRALSMACNWMTRRYSTRARRLTPAGGGQPELGSAAGGRPHAEPVSGHAPLTVTLHNTSTGTTVNQVAKTLTPASTKSRWSTTRMAAALWRACVGSRACQMRVRGQYQAQYHSNAGLTGGDPAYAQCEARRSTTIGATVDQVMAWDRTASRSAGLARSTSTQGTTTSRHYS